MKSCLSFLLLLTASLPLCAQTQSISDEIVVTASALPETIETTPASITVIARKDIDSRGALDVADLLREVPGLTVSRTGSSGHATSLFTRGSNSVHTLVMWNGIEINNPFFGGYDWGQFSTAGIERVEVVRGPFSALYGSDAVAGVVNILSEPDRTGVQASVESGGNELRNGQLAASYVQSHISASGSFASRHDGGFASNDDFEQQSANAAAHWNGLANLNIGAAVRYTSYDLGVPTNLDGSGDSIIGSPHRRQNGIEQQFAIPITQTIGAFTYDLGLSDTRRRDELRDPDDPWGLLWQTTTARTRRARLSTTTRIARFGTIVGGAEYERAIVDDVTSFGPNFTGRKRDHRALFVEDRYSAGFGTARLELSAGVRRDDYDTFGSATSPRIAVAVLSRGNKLRAAYGEAFRAPSLGELYSPFGGNPDLRAEHSRSMEIGYDRFASRGEISVTLFRDSYRELIANSGFVFANVGRARSRGLELSGRAHLAAAFEAGASYTFVDARQLDSGARLLRRPPHSGSAFVTYRRGAVQTNLVVLHTGVRDDILPVMPFSRVSDEAHTTVDINLQYRMGRLVPFARLENATGTQYEEVRGYPSPRRRLALGVRFAM